MTTAFIGVFLAIIMVITARGYDVAIHQTQADKIQYAEYICDKAHLSDGGDSEQQCGDALDKVNATYLCNQTSTRCWVESK